MPGQAGVADVIHQKIKKEKLLMAVHLKNKKRALINSKLIALCCMFCAGILLCWILYPDKADSGPYIISAHGDSTNGVNRSGLASFSYSKGNCVHCHEQHTSIGGTSLPQPPAQAYELFRTLFVDQTSMFCFDCHTATGSSLQTSMPIQYSYSVLRGGATLACPSDIWTAFQYEDAAGNSNLVNPCPGVLQFGSSAHLLSAIQNYLVSQWGFSATQADIDPCSGCHDPHRAQQNYPVSRPSTHTSLLTWELWGDDDNTTERLTVAVKVPPATGGYMSPYNVVSGYEEDTFPAGITARTTKFRRVCRDCHDNNPPAGLADVNWGSAYHGGTNSSNTSYGGLVAPYSTAASTSYNLNCTDCHEPHGSRNEYLLRWEVNGVTDIRIADSTGTYQTGRWYNFCIACHTYISAIAPHNPASQVGASNVQDMDCTFGNCHGHGGLNF
jgi:hypothetical protein